MPLNNGGPFRQLLCTRRKTVSAAFLFLLSFLSIPRALPQYRSTQWTADSGLPQNIVRGIVQAPDGYMWIATLNGLARFDGMHFAIFDKSNSP
jgi:ligand-binding sensor domain-containing protein